MAMFRNLLLIIMLAFIFASCEDSMVLRSEKKMKSELQGRWQREFLGDTSIHYNEFWNFNGDKLYTTYEQLEPPDNGDDGAKDSTIADNVDTVLISGFKIDARTFRAYLKLQLIDRGLNDTTVFIDKWEFVTLDIGVL